MAIQIAGTEVIDNSRNIKNVVNVGNAGTTVYYGDGSNLTNISVAPFPSGTVMLFQQTAAPTGWTKSVTHNDKALRVVNGTASSGGTTAFSSVFTSRTPAGTVSSSSGPVTISGPISGTVGSTTLTASQIPAHTHSYNVVGAGSGLASGANFTGASPTNTGNNSPAGGSHSHPFSGTFTDTAHNHTVSSSFTGTALDFAVSYVDVIFATKD